MYCEGCIHSLGWTTGLAFTHVVVGLIDPQLLRAFRGSLMHNRKPALKYFATCTIALLYLNAA